MRFLSICSGIEAASVAWEPLGWRAAAFSEIEAFPSAVLKHRWPGVPNLGDMTKHEEWSLDESIDLVVGGTPCQAFSVAGLRKGLSDPRGNLTLVFLGIVDRVRPKWVVWENVPGVLSDESGAFGAFLGGLAELGYGWAYRILDAQYVRVDGHARAVPQRRRRVFVVGHLGGQWQRAAAVLFERESLCGNPAPRRESGKGTAPTLSARTQGGGGLGTDFDCDGGTIPVGIDGGDVGFALPAEGSHSGDKGDGGMNQTTVIAFPSRMSGTQCAAAEDVSSALGSANETAVAHSLKADGFDASEDGTGRGTPLVPEAWPKEAADTLTAAYSDKQGLEDQHVNSGCGLFVPERMAVRRLTPRECERLQGFPDDYTLIPWRGREAEACPDGPRYKALGNSMAVNVMRWIGRRIEDVEAIRPRMEHGMNTDL